MSRPGPQSPGGFSITQRILGTCLLIITLVIAILLALMVRQFNASIQQQADALGEALITHTALEVATPLAMSDSLALAAVLQELVKTPYVAHAALYNMENRTLAEAGRRPRKGNINSLYSKSVTSEQVVAGQLHLSIDVKRLQQPLYHNLQGLALLGVILLLGAVLLLSRLARSISLPLGELQHWLIQPVGPAPQQQRGDEIGLLARTLGQHFNLPVEATAYATETEAGTETSAENNPDPQTEVAPPEPAPLPEHTAVLAVELKLVEGIFPLPDGRREQLQAHYRQALDEVAALYQGQLHSLDTEQALMLFHDTSENHLAHALCAGELLRGFAHALQIELAGSDTTLGIQLGIAQGAAVTDQELSALRQHQVVEEALELCQHSRNLVLVGQSAALHAQAACASIREIARPAAASCIERLLPPWPEQLDGQLQKLVAITLTEEQTQDSQSAGY